MASELGSMVVTEQIDAMRALGTDPMKKLVTPRVTATVFMLFFLSIISDLVGLAGGLMVAKLFLSLDARQYWSNAWQVLVFQDVFMGLLKPVMFGFIIATIGCYYGMTARGGTQGVGRATTQAVVAASVLILVTDFFVTKLVDFDFVVQVTHVCAHAADRPSRPTSASRRLGRRSCSKMCTCRLKTTKFCAECRSSCLWAKPRRCLALQDRARARF